MEAGKPGIAGLFAGADECLLPVLLAFLSRPGNRIVANDGRNVGDPKFSGRFQDNVHVPAPGRGDQEMKGRRRAFVDIDGKDAAQGMPVLALARLVRLQDGFGNCPLPVHQGQVVAFLETEDFQGV